MRTATGRPNMNKHTPSHANDHTPSSLYTCPTFPSPSVSFAYPSVIPIPIPLLGPFLIVLILFIKAPFTHSLPISLSPFIQYVLTLALPFHNIFSKLSLSLIYRPHFRYSVPPQLNLLLSPLPCLFSSPFFPVYHPFPPPSFTV